jgi:NADP-dependent 3-hydroxy acid dehydrogenase YdfG/Flp pilus assembly protein TadD
MGKDLMESVELDESNKEESEETKVLELFDAEETEKIDKRVSQLLEEDEEESEEDEEELEGYFVDEEEEEAEEEDDELDEYDVLQSSNILVQSGNISEGIDLLKAVLEEAPEFVSVRYQYAAFLAQYQNDFREASNQLAILLEEDPNNLSAKFFLGELAEAQRDYLTAKSYFEKVYEQNPNFPNIAYKLGLLLINPLKESPEKAAKYLKEAYEQNPNNINALYQLGGLQSEISKEPDQAIASFTEVLEKAPEHPFANYDLALIYYDKQDWEKALSYYEKACLINPELKTDENDQAFALEEIEEDISLEALSAEIGQKVEQQLNETIETKNPIASEVFVADRPPVVKNGAVYGEKKIEETQEEGVEEKISAMPQVPKQEKGIQKTVLITGSTSGIGRATAEAFAKNGYRLILTGRRFSRLFIMKEQFEESYGTDIRLLPFDIRSSQAIQSAIIELEEEWQDIDILINNAGLAKGSTTIQGGKLEDWENMIDTNLKGLLYITRAILPSMIKRKQGQIINVCSLAGHEVYANSGVYCATKHAVDALTKAMRLDLHQHRIRVSQVSPGFVEGTEFALVRHNGNEAAVENLFEDFTPANTADVANAIYFIASQPPHLNIQEITLAGTQQASASVIDRSGRFEG